MYRRHNFEVTRDGALPWFGGTNSSLANIHKQITLNISIASNLLPKSLISMSG